MVRLTQKQRDVFQRIVSYNNLHKFYPSAAKLAVIFSISRDSVRDRIKALEKKGYLVNEDGIYKPTLDGIEQYMKDSGTNRIKKGR